MTEEKRMEKGHVDSHLSGLRYLRVIRGQKERKRKRLEKALDFVVMEIYSLDKKIDRQIFEEECPTIRINEDVQGKVDKGKLHGEEESGGEKKDV